MYSKYLCMWRLNGTPHPYTQVLAHTHAQDHTRIYCFIFDVCIHPTSDRRPEITLLLQQLYQTCGDKQRWVDITRHGGCSWRAKSMIGMIGPRGALKPHGKPEKVVMWVPF